MLALAFSLTIAAAIVFLVVRTISSFNTKVVLNPSSVRGFKQDELSTTMECVFKRGRWVNARLSSVKARPGVETRFEITEGLTKVFVKSKYAGKFPGLSLEFDVVDILNLFSKRIQTVYADFTYDSLPLSLLAPIPHSRPMPLTLGEKSGRRPGSSMELYALEDYQPFSEAKNVMWKKVAQMPDEKLIVRVRDSSIPSKVRVGFIQAKIRNEEERLQFIDLSCEAIGMIGNSLLAAGSSLEILCASKEELPFSVYDATELDELSDALMRLPQEPVSINNLERQFEILVHSDLIVCGTHDLEQKALSFAIAKKPAVAISEKGASPFLVGNQVLTYTGVEDLHGLISKVLEV